MEYETISVTTDTKKQLATMKKEYGYETYEAVFKDIIAVIEEIHKRGGLEVQQ